ncbi:MAG: 30S ribosomal protein S2 [Pseudomonadales bacterium]|nr:30S ribosomal protein S2 [Pseudomonadales bacterium]
MKDYSKLPKVAPEYDLTDLLEAGCHFGHQKSKWNPKMAEFIYMEKDGVHIFDLEKTASQLQLAYNFVYDLASRGKTMIMVGTKKQAKPIIEEVAKENEVMYITSRWLGGLLTNWDQVKKSLKRMLSIGTDLKAGKYDAYTKFEKVQLEKEEIRLQRFFGGIQELKSTPDFLFIVDVKREKNAIKEALLMGVPIIALIDSNADPEDVDIAIPANDDALRSINFIVSEIAKAYAAGRRSIDKSGRVVAVPKVVEAKTPVVEAKTPVVEAKTPVVEAKTLEVKEVTEAKPKVVSKPKAEAKSNVALKAKPEAKSKVKAKGKPEAKAIEAKPKAALKAKKVVVKKK